jgi:hypothetical protein
MQQLETGTGGAYAPLSEILPSARGARFVRMTNKCAPLFEVLPLRSRCGARFGQDETKE